jgi:hypothetical protein
MENKPEVPASEEIRDIKPPQPMSEEEINYLMYVMNELLAN